jgi:4a-hydroxytetrahydrobiopterin dehydratase
MSEELAEMSCKMCVGATETMPVAQQQEMLAKIPNWEIVDNHHLHRRYKFKNFKQALAFVNQVGEVAETEKHHPDIYFTWGKVTIQIMTHSVDGLTEADFVLAAKLNRIS